MNIDKAFFPSLHQPSAARGRVLALLAVMVLGMALPAQGQDSQQPVTITVSKKKMAVNENLVVEISTSLPLDQDQFAGPAFEDFVVLGGPQFMRSMVSSYVNGKGRTEQKTTISYLVQPKREGTLYIEPAMVKSKGQKYQTERIAIEVGKAIEGQQSIRQMSNPSTSAQQNIHLVAEVSDTRPYVGEPITVTYKLYYRMNIGRLSVTQVPKFDTFWTQVYTEDDLPENKTDQRGYYKDELYHVITYHKVLLIPQKEGRQTIPSLSLSMLVEVGTGQYDYWGDEITRTAQHSVASQPIQIEVRPLPSEGRPDNFSGGVGQFSLKTDLSKSKVNTGESSTLNLEVRGTGNITQIRMPEPTFPSEIERYDPKLQTSTALGPNSLRGSLSEQFILIPRVKGQYTIPKIEFSYFNPDTGKYVTLSSNPMTLEVSGDDIANHSISQKARQNPATSTKEDVDYLNTDIGFIRLSTDLQPASYRPFYQRFWFSLLLLLPLIAIPVALGKRIYDASVDRNSPQAKAKKAAQAARARLSRAKKALDRGDYPAFYYEMEKSLYSFIASKLKLARKDASIDRIRQEVLARGADPATADELIGALEACNQARYAGFNPAQSETDYQNATRAIVNINKCIKG